MKAVLSMKTARKIGFVVTAACILALASCWLPYFSSELSTGLMFGGMLGEPVAEYTGRYEGWLEVDPKDILYVPEQGSHDRGMLVVRDEGSYRITLVEFEESGSWSDATQGQFHVVLPIPEVPELEFFGSITINENVRYLIRGSNQQLWSTFLADGSYVVETVAPNTVDIGNITYNFSFIGAQQNDGGGQFTVSAVVTNATQPGHAENSFSWPDATSFIEEWSLTTSSYPFDGTKAPDVGTSLRTEGNMAIVSGLWGSTAKTYYKDGQDEVKRADRVTDLLTSQLTNEIAYSQKLGSVTFYDVLDNKKLFTLSTGTVRLIGDVMVNEVPKVQFTWAFYDVVTGTLKVRVYEVPFSKLEDIAN